MRMDPKRARARLRVLAVLATLASSAIGRVFVAMAGGMSPGLRFLLLIPIISAPALVALLVLLPARARSRARAARMALREGGLVQEDKTIVLVKQKRLRKLDTSYVERTGFYGDP